MPDSSAVEGPTGLAQQESSSSPTHKTTMKAAFFDEYGPPEVLQIKEVEKPTPKDNELLVRVLATTVSSGDVRVRSSTFPRGFWLFARIMMGLFKPKTKILGFEFSGEVESVGKNVTKFQPGDSVFGGTDFWLGANAEYVCVSEDSWVALKPYNLTFEEAAAVFSAGGTGLFFLRDKGRLKDGDSILINGGSGALGTAGIQLAKCFGAEITAVCSSPNHDLVRSLGAVKVIDYTKEDFTQRAESYDVIYDTVGNLSVLRSARVLRKGGRFLAAVADLPQLLQSLTLVFRSKKMIGGTPSSKQEYATFLKELIENGRFKPVIDKTYRLEEIVEAHRYVQQGHKKGNVVLTVHHD